LDDNHSAFSRPRLQRAIQLLGQVDWVGTDISPTAPTLIDFKQQRDAIGKELEIQAQLQRVSSILDARYDTAKANNQATDELESYAALIKDVGY